MRAAGLSRQQRRAINREAEKKPPRLTPVPQEQWPADPPGALSTRLGVWVSQKFLVQHFKESKSGAQRLSINRTTVDATGDWCDEISWDELQQIKRDVGFGNYCAVEIFPPDIDLVNVANMRHLWLLGTPPPFMWRSPPI